MRVYPRFGTVFLSRRRFLATMRGSNQYLSLATHCAPQAMSRVRVFLSEAPILMATKVLARGAPFQAWGLHRRLF